MPKILLLLTVCFICAAIVATISAQGGTGAGGGQGRGAPAGAPTGPAPTGANGAADLQEIMLRVQYTNMTMHGKLAATDSAGVAEDLGTLQSLFTAAQMAFTKEKIKGASDLAKAAAAAAGAAQKVAKSGTVNAATANAVTEACNGCHMTYRVKDDSGAYKLKAN